MTDRITDADLAAMELREKAATKGPWHYYPCGDKCNDCILGAAFDENCESPPPGVIDLHPFNEDTQEYEMDKYIFDPVIAGNIDDANYSNYAFMAHARTDIPRLLAEVRRLRAATAHLSVCRNCKRLRDDLEVGFAPGGGLTKEGFCEDCMDE